MCHLLNWNAEYSTWVFNTSLGKNACGDCIKMKKWRLSQTNYLWFDKRIFHCESGSALIAHVVPGARRSIRARHTFLVIIPMIHCSRRARHMLLHEHIAQDGHDTCCSRNTLLNTCPTHVACNCPRDTSLKTHVAADCLYYFQFIIINTTCGTDW